MKISPMNCHNDLDYKIITRIQEWICSYINESSSYINELTILNRILINDHSLDQKWPKFFSVCIY